MISKKRDVTKQIYQRRAKAEHTQVVKTSIRIQKPMHHQLQIREGGREVFMID